MNDSSRGGSGATTGEAEAKAFRRFLQEGQYGIYAKLNEKVVGHAWAKACTENHCIVNGYMDISEGEALIHFCNVSECERGGNTYPAMLITLCRRLFCEAQVSRVIIDTEADNHASLRGIVKVGFKLFGMGTYFQFCGRLLFKRFEYVKE